MFVSLDDYNKLESIINTTDNTSNQCLANERACLNGPRSFKYYVDAYYVREEFKSDGTVESVWEGQQSRGQLHGLNRYSSLTYGQSSLNWYTRGKLDGKYMLNYLSYAKCYKLIYQNSALKGGYTGNDMRTPF